MSTLPIGRLFAVPMPTNAEGTGPEMNPELVVRTDWELWDECNMSYGQCLTEAVATELARRWNLHLESP